MSVRGNVRTGLATLLGVSLVLAVLARFNTALGIAPYLLVLVFPWTVNPSIVTSLALM